MPRDRPGLGDHAPAQDPLPPTEVDVLKVGKIVVVEAAGVEERFLPDRHQAAAREEPVFPGVRRGQLADRTSHVCLKGVAVEGQETVGEIVPLAREINQAPGRGDHVGGRARKRGGEQPQSLGLHTGVVVDERQQRRASRFRPQSAAGREADVAIRDDPAQVRVPAEDFFHRLSGRVVHQNRLHRGPGRGRGDGVESLDQMPLSPVMDDDDRKIGPVHARGRVTQEEELVSGDW